MEDKDHQIEILKEQVKHLIKAKDADNRQHFKERYKLEGHINNLYKLLDSFTCSVENLERAKQRYLDLEKVKTDPLAG